MDHRTSHLISLGEAESPPAGSRNVPFGQPFPAYYDDGDSDTDMPPVQPSGMSWWQRLKGTPPPQQHQPQSGYLTLIPLSDSRLKPRRTKLIVATLLVLTVVSVLAVYFTVARGVTVGTIDVVSSTISFNTTGHTYQILLSSTIPIYNPNYSPVRVSGMINVSFYDQQAGYTILEPVQIPARAKPEIITVDINSSSVPQKYLFTIYTQCFTFPEQLIFFLRADLKVEYLGSVSTLPRIDNYAIIACNSGSSPDREQRAVASPQLPQLGAEEQSVRGGSLNQGIAQGDREPEKGRASQGGVHDGGLDTEGQLHSGESAVDPTHVGVAEEREGGLGQGGAGVKQQRLRQETHSLDTSHEGRGSVHSGIRLHDEESDPSQRL